MFNANGLGAHSGLDLLAAVAARSSTGSATPGDGASPNLSLSSPGLGCTTQQPSPGEVKMAKKGPAIETSVFGAEAEEQTTSTAGYRQL